MHLNTRRRFRVRAGLFVGILCLLPTGDATAQCWIPLFDGQSLHGWQTQDGQPVSRGWQVERGILHLTTGQERGGNILTDREYGDFELVFEWKIAAQGNSGIKYRVRDFDGQVLGCEYQMIDDKRYGPLGAKQLTASLYDLYEPGDGGHLKADDFNRGAIVVQGNRIEHWLNGRLVVDAQVGSAEWQARITQSKFSDVNGFGANRCGRIMLTDHNSEVWFRNMFLRPLCSTSNRQTAATSPRPKLVDPLPFPIDRSLPANADHGRRIGTNPPLLWLR